MTLSKARGSLGARALQLVLFCVFGSLALQGAASQRPVRMPTGSFLLRPALSRQQLVNQVRNSPVEMHRFEAVFHLSAHNVLVKLSELRLAKLPADRVMDVYFIHPGNHIAHRGYTVKRGTLVWLDAAGNPVLIKMCGNPCTVLKGVAMMPRPLLSGESITMQPQQVAAAVLPQPETPVDVANFVGSSPGIIPAGAVPFGGVYRSQVPVAGAHGGVSPIWLLPVLGGIFGSGGGGGHKPSVAPESDTIYLFLAGLISCGGIAGLATVRRRRRTG
ncbi:MAG: hypothetical protein KGJ62_01105 [Armatimonadetes bacterium]|nr:hypothetical protein [Armatimonadota bacterium]MDE2207623.1 hypothetical protein [Armatimonadota bacterium]